MNFNNRSELMNKLNSLKPLSFGSQGMCYLDGNNNLVYKIYHQFLDDYKHIKYNYDYIMRFSNVSNNTYIFPKDVIEVNNKIVGYIMNYIDSKDLFSVNPLLVKLERLITNINNVSIDIEHISDNGILSYDVMYNILYKTNFNIIDTEEYMYKDIDPNILYVMNKQRFDYAIYNFLVDGYFNEFVNSYRELKNMYKDKSVDVVIFIELLRKYLSEYIGDEVSKLNDAKECMNKRKVLEPFYIRDIKIK